MDDRDHLERIQSKMRRSQPQNISTFDSVPDEILNEIFKYVAGDLPFFDGRHEVPYLPHPLLPVVQVNRRFNALASALMVRKWRVELNDISLANEAAFVLYLLKQPHLRSQVRSLALYILSFDAPSFDDSDMPTVEVGQLVESAEKACGPLAGMRYDHGEVSWCGQIGLRSPSAISGLLLAWATELRELDLTFHEFDPAMVQDVDEGRPDPWPFVLVKLAAGVLSPRWGTGHDLPPPAMFTKLRCVTLRHDDDGPFFQGTRAASFFRLPSLRVFKAYGMDARGLTLDQADQSATGTALQPSADQLFPNRTSAVEEIHLYWSHISENGLRVLTRACKRLRVLVLQWTWNNEDIHDFSFLGDAILDIIKLYFNSLEEILIDSTLGVESYGDVDSRAFGDWLWRCEKLQRLSIDLEVLYGDENYENNSSSYPLSLVLPAGLTSLCLRHGTKSTSIQATTDNVLGLLRCCGPKGRFSRLTKIHLIEFIMDADEKRDLIVLAQKAGVELTLREQVDTDQSLMALSVGFF